MSVDTLDLGFLNKTDFNFEDDMKDDLKPKKNYRVVLNNSDYAEFNCIITSLVEMFSFSHDDAINLAQTAHTNGSVALGEWTRDVCDTQVMLAQGLLKELHEKRGLEEPSNVYTSVPME